MPVSNISVVGVSSSTVGADRWIGQRSLTSMSAPWSIGSPGRVKKGPGGGAPAGAEGGPLVDRLPEQVEDAPERDVPDGDGDRPAGAKDLRPAREAVGGVHGDG